MAAPFTIAQTVGGTYVASASSTTISMGNITNGNLMLVVVCSNTQAVSSITDTLNNTYTLIDAQVPSQDVELWYTRNIIGGTTPTITVTVAGASAISCLAREYSGPRISNPLDQHVASNNLSTALDSGPTKVTNTSTQLVIGWGGVQNGNPTYTVGAGFGNLSTQQGVSQSVSCAIEDQVVTTPGTQDATMTSSISTNWACGVATFATGSNLYLSKLRPHIFSPGIGR